MKNIALRDLAIEHFKKAKTNREVFDILAGKVSLRTVQHWAKEFKSIGKTRSNVSTGRPRTVSNHIVKRRIKILIKTFSQRKISLKLKISLSSVSRIVRELNLKVLFLY